MLSISSRAQRMRFSAVLFALVFGACFPCFGQAWPTSCPSVPDYDLGSSIRQATERNDILRLRRSVEEFAAAIDSYSICLNSALADLKSERMRAGRSVDPLVPQIVANLLQAALSEKRTVLSSYSLAVSAYNNKHATPDGLDGVTDLNISYALPPESAIAPIPAGSQLLSIPAHAIFNAVEDDACFTAFRKVTHTSSFSGTALVAFDVDAKGELSNVRLVQSVGQPDWDQVALACTATRKYAPAIRDGDPVPSPNHVMPMKFEVGQPHQ